MLLAFTVTLLFQFRLEVTEQYCLFTPTFFERVFNTESQGSIDELASDGKTAPKAALTRCFTFRIKCGDDGFQPVSFDVSQHSST